MWESNYRFIDFGRSYDFYHSKFYKKELYPNAENPGGRSDETHQFILQLNDKKFKNIKFVKQENKKAMTQEQIIALRNRKEMKKIIKKNNREILSYFDF